MILHIKGTRKKDANMGPFYFDDSPVLHILYRTALITPTSFKGGRPSKCFLKTFLSLNCTFVKESLIISYQWLQIGEVCVCAHLCMFVTSGYFQDRPLVRKGNTHISWLRQRPVCINRWAQKVKLSHTHIMPLNIYFKLSSENKGRVEN